MDLAECGRIVNEILALLAQADLRAETAADAFSRELFEE